MDNADTTRIEMLEAQLNEKERVINQLYTELDEKGKQLTEFANKLMVAGHDLGHERRNAEEMFTKILEVFEGYGYVPVVPRDDRIDTLANEIESLTTEANDLFSSVDTATRKINEASDEMSTIYDRASSLSVDLDDVFALAERIAAND